MRKAIVFGNNGQLGRELIRVLTERGYELTHFGRADANVADATRIEALIAPVAPDLVFNATAYNAVDRAESEPQSAYEGNALAVRNLAVACRGCGAQLVHYSTDYVFDGTSNRPYNESDPAHPLGAYGVSKLAGEFYAFAYLNNALVIRTCGVFGPGGANNGNGNFVETMLKKAAAGQPLRVVADYVASPTYAPALAERSVDLIERGQSGLYHIGGGTPMSWFEYARLIFDVANTTADLSPTTEQEYRTPARRPKYSALSNSKMEQTGIAPMPSLAEAVESYMRRREQVLSSKA